MQTASAPSSSLTERPTVTDLHESGRYQLVESFSIDAMMDFVRRELHLPAAQPKKSARYSVGSLLTMLMVGLVSGWLGFWVAKTVTGQPDKLAGVWQLGGAFVAIWVVLALHEYIHGLTYRWIGAPSIGYGYSVRSLMVYAYSQAFPVTLGELAFVAVMPFVVITSSLCLGWVGLPQYGVFWGTLLLIHTLGCAGDLALIVYWWRNRSRPMYTYDDITGKRMTYFFEAL